MLQLLEADGLARHAEEASKALDTGQIFKATRY